MSFLFDVWWFSISGILAKNSLKIQSVCIANCHKYSHSTAIVSRKSKYARYWCPCFQYRRRVIDAKKRVSILASIKKGYIYQTFRSDVRIHKTAAVLMREHSKRERSRSFNQRTLHFMTNTNAHTHQMRHWDWMRELYRQEIWLQQQCVVDDMNHSIRIDTDQCFFIGSSVPFTCCTIGVKETFIKCLILWVDKVFAWNTVIFLAQIFTKSSHIFRSIRKTYFGLITAHSLINVLDKRT